MKKDLQSFEPFEFSIIGFGRVGSCLARSLTDLGCNCVGIQTSQISKLQDSYSGVEFPALQDESTLGDICFICVPDDAISTVASNLVEKQSVHSKTNFVHVSGTRSSIELQILKEIGTNVASFHPLQTFHPGADIKIFNDILMSIEGDEELVDELFSLALQLGARPVQVTTDQKKAIHIAAVFVSNFQSSLVIEASSIIGTQFDNPEHFVRKNFSTLMHQTINNISSKGFPDAITGPAARNDLKTLQLHSDFLIQHKIDPALYRELSEVIKRYMQNAD